MEAEEFMGSTLEFVGAVCDRPYETNQEGGALPLPCLLLLNDQVDQLVLDNDGLADLAALLCQESSDLLVCQDICNNCIVLQVCIHHDSAAHLAVDLNSDGNLGILALFFTVSGPGLVSDSVVMTQHLPDFLTNVGNDAGDHLDEALCILSGASTVLVDFVDEHHHLRNGLR